MDGYFNGRKPRHPNEIEIAMNAAMLERLADEVGIFHVKRDFNNFGIARRTTEKGFAVLIQPHGDKGEVERFMTWHDAAAAGWQVD